MTVKIAALVLSALLAVGALSTLPAAPRVVLAEDFTATW
jgi:hypothetical protein